MTIKPGDRVFRVHCDKERAVIVEARVVDRKRAWLTLTDGERTWKDQGGWHGSVREAAAVFVEGCAWWLHVMPAQTTPSQRIKWILDIQDEMFEWGLLVGRLHAGAAERAAGKASK